MALCLNSTQPSYTNTFLFLLSSTLTISSLSVRTIVRAYNILYKVILSNFTPDNLLNSKSQHQQHTSNISAISGMLTTGDIMKFEHTNLTLRLSACVPMRRKIVGAGVLWSTRQLTEARTDARQHQHLAIAYLK